ncbi:MAG: hypothetical protein RLY20_1855 [Verrucomicrobiota bacterium]
MKAISSVLLTAAVMALPFANSVRADDKVPLAIKLPAPAFKGTPKELPEGMTVDPMIDEKVGPAPLLVAPGCVNLVAGLKPTSSDTNATPEKLAKITDGDKEAYETSIVLLRKGVQNVTFDLGKPAELYAIVIWHAHDSAKVYRNVVVQVADDAGFTKNVRTLFNNDAENKAGQGAGTDKQYFEQHYGKRIVVNGEKAQFVRLWSRGSTESALNEYTEVEVWGKPVK